jgi:hypothetical protein
MGSLFLRSSRRRSTLVVAAAVSAVAGLTLITALAPPPTTNALASGGTEYATASSGFESGATQTLEVPGEAVAGAIARDGYGATPGVVTIARERTNRAWATLVMYFGGFPMTESNVTVMLRWMRQENGPDDWWLRNNPLNNGWGSGGGSGLGSYDTLVTAAENAAEALRENSLYSEITAGFDASAPTAQIEAAIWASPWASSHYANGAHWSYSPVPVVTAPADAWGQ